MPDHINQNNPATISRLITENFRLCPGNPEKNLHMTDLAVKRMSGCIDYIPVTVHTKTADEMHNHIGQSMQITV